VKVLGPDAHPFYRWAALERPRDLPRWNFHKYLVGKDGRIADVFSTITDPTSATVLRAVEREFRSTSAG
jgi:glutathione peroxidase